MSHDFWLLLATLLYLGAAIVLYRSARRPEGKARSLSPVLGSAGLLCHGVAQYGHWFGSTAPDVSLVVVLSLCALVIVLTLLATVPSRSSLYDAGLVALPMAAAITLIEFFCPAQGPLLEPVGTGTAVHIISSVGAFSVLSIAGVYALFVAIIDHFLRHHHLNPLVRALPALDVLESLLIGLIAVGFALLTLSIGSGLLFVNDLFAQHLAHKTVLSILAWLLFGILLWGRWRFGWRGRTAVRLTLAGFVLLLLSYFGSKLVLETILGRNWQA